MQMFLSTFWVEAFTTAIFLINRLLTITLKWESPYYMLYHKTLDYKSLRVFGSRCYPYVWDQKTSKFDTKSLPCVFLGYSDRHKGYRCYYPPTRRTFISRHVAFDEDSLHFKTQVSNNKSASDFLVTTFKEWDFSKSPMCSHSLPSANTKHPTPNAPLNKQLILSNLVFGAELQSNTVPAYAA
ncbi:hypothetical protein Patl1_34919 [Pistacia atlantica]|uniref:Uncharacterized protein n=1 Tax=Pistacia atlantica TaxID=434234 RepID=A0ACC0ZW83_9ROSI|nr:hypothetical protein Patl1_34919 [Pistacia atlantica]